MNQPLAILACLARKVTQRTHRGLMGNVIGLMENVETVSAPAGERHSKIKRKLVRQGHKEGE